MHSGRNDNTSLLTDDTWEKFWEPHSEFEFDVKETKSPKFSEGVFTHQPKPITQKRSKTWLTFRYVEIEEIAIKNSLYTSCYDGYQIKEALEVIAVDPVEDVEGPVGAEGEQVVTRDRLGLACLADHEQLRQDGHRFQVDGERPQNLQQHWHHVAPCSCLLLLALRGACVTVSGPGAHNVVWGCVPQQNKRRQARYHRKQSLRGGITVSGQSPSWTLCLSFMNTRLENSQVTLGVLQVGCLSGPWLLAGGGVVVCH